MQSLFTMRVAKDGQRLSFEWVLLPSNRDALRKALEVGSVSYVPSTISIRMNSSRC